MGFLQKFSGGPGNFFNTVQSSESIDVLVIGAGIAGVAAATALHRQGFEVILAEKLAEPAKIFKGEYFQPQAVQIARQLGMGEVFDGDDVSSIMTLNFTDLGPGNQDVLSQITLNYPRGTSAKAMTHHRLSQKLFAHAEKTLGDSFWRQTTVTLNNEDDPNHLNHPEFTLKNPNRAPLTVRPRWVLGCDGRNSSVRRWIKAESLQKQGPATFGSKPEFIVGAEIHCSPPQNGQYHVVRTSRSGTVSVFPVEGMGKRVYWNYPVPEEGLTNSKKVWGEGLQNLMSQTKVLASHGDIDLNHINGAPANTSWDGSIGSGRFLLAGDAAAVTTPFGGQGMTCAMIHVKALLDDSTFLKEKPSKAKKAIEKYGKVVASSYSRINLLNFGLYYFFFARHPAFKLAARHVLYTWQKNPSLGDRTMRLFGGLDLDKPSLAEVTRLWGMNNPFISLLNKQSYSQALRLFVSK